MKVHIIQSDDAYDALYDKYGFTLVNSIEDADIIQFTGGADVSPDLYGQEKHPTTFTQRQRDFEDLEAYTRAQGLDKICVGICRGGQFLNIMCGGAMWQDVDGHATGKTHEAYDTRLKESLHVTSTHHQMMIPRQYYGVPFLVACETTKKERVSFEGVLIRNTEELLDIEAIYYPEKKVMCYQPHPEYLPDSDMARHFFKSLDFLVEHAEGRTA
jgi:gamma-glutamyl-gamma-aminobutyrate hydrolase PuuD